MFSISQAAKYSPTLALDWRINGTLYYSFQSFTYKSILPFRHSYLRFPSFQKSAKLKAIWRRAEQLDRAGANVVIDVSTSDFTLPVARMYPFSDGVSDAMLYHSPDLGTHSNDDLNPHPPAHLFRSPKQTHRAIPAHKTLISANLRESLVTRSNVHSNAVCRVQRAFNDIRHA